MGFLESMTPRRSGHYSSVATAEEYHDASTPSPKSSTDSGSRLKKEISSLDDDIVKPRRCTSQRILLCINLILFLSSTVMFSMSAKSIFWNKENERNYFLKQVSEKSPILDAIDIPMKTWRLNGTFIEMDPPSIFRQPPSPEVDAAWERVEDQSPIPITRQDVINQGRDPDEAVKFPESFGFGPDAYVGRIDVLHQIHCLNRIRKHLHFNFDYYYGGERMNKYHEYHVSHCIYTLLQNLQCTGNTDVYSHFWADAQENAYPDFSINHKCRDFNAILEYHDKHMVPLEEFGAIRKPPGQKARVMSHAFKEAFEWYDAEHPDVGETGTGVGKI